jgi:hypothetical protein
MSLPATLHQIGPARGAAHHQPHTARGVLRGRSELAGELRRLARAIDNDYQRADDA